MTRRIAALALFVLVAGPVVAIEFDAPIVSDIPGPGAGNRLVVGDLDGDCDLDMVNSRDLTIAAEDPSMSVMIGDGDGVYPDIASADGGQNISGMALADLNGDGILDLINTENFDGAATPFGLCTSTTPQVPVFLGDGVGGFVFLGCLTAKLHPSAVVAADFYEDGRVDLLVANAPTALGGTTSPDVVLFRGNGDGSFEPARVVFQKRADDLAVADFDGDGRLDVAVAARSTTFVYFGGGNGTFTPLGVGLTGDARRVAAGDINGDGFPDIASVGSIESQSSDDRLWTAINDGAGGFDPPTPYDTGSHPVDVVIEDLDLDGYGDVVVANNLGDSVSVFAGMVDGSLAVPTVHDAGRDPMAIAVRDLDKDGYPDIAAVNRNVATGGSIDDGTVSVLLQTVTAALEVTTGRLPTGEVGTPYATCLSSRGGTPPYSWSLSVGVVPPGLLLDGATGRIAGTPVTPGIEHFTAQVDDGALDSATKALWIDVGDAPPPPPSAASDPGAGMFAMTITGYDPGTGLVGILYDPACGATDHAAHSGPLSLVGVYGYDRTDCGLGTTGAADVDVGAGSRFWVLSGRNARYEGSASTDSEGIERPGPPAVTGCWVEQVIGEACP